MRRHVVLVDQQAILRACLGAILDQEHDLEVVGHADTLATAVALCQAAEPDVVVMDISPVDTFGARAVTEVRRSAARARLLVLTAESSGECIQAALSAGADGYVLKDASRTEFLRGMRSVLQGQRYICTGTQARVLQHWTGEREHPDGLQQVTTRERQVLALIASGKSNKAIAVVIKRSVKTVEKHRGNLMHKLALKNAADLTRLAVRMGLVAL